MGCVSAIDSNARTLGDISRTPLMKQKLKSILQKIRRSFYSRDLFSHYPEELLKTQTDAKVAQLALQQHYKTLLRLPKPSLPTFREIGFRQYSQFEEDGILLYLFSIIAPENRSCL